MAWTPYNQVLKRMKEREQENPFYRQAMNAQRQLTQPYQQMKRELTRRQNQGNMTEAGLAESMMRSNQLLSEAQRNIWDQAGLMQIQRNEGIQDAIAEIEQNKANWQEAERRREEAEEEAKRHARNQFLMQAGGAGLGLLLGGPVGAKMGIKGAGGLAMAMKGAQIGAGLGKTAAGLFNETYDVALQGFADTLGGLNSLATLKEERKFLGAFNNLDFDNYTRDDLYMLSLFAQQRNLEAIASLDNNVKQRAERKIQAENTRIRGLSQAEMSSSQLNNQNLNMPGIGFIKPNILPGGLPLSSNDSPRALFDYFNSNRPMELRQQPQLNFGFTPKAPVNNFNLIPQKKNDIFDNKTLRLRFNQ